MNDTTQGRHDVLTWRRLPSRLHLEDAATVLGFNNLDIPVLMKAGLLKPLGNPAPSAPKYFAAVEIVQWERIGGGSTGLPRRSPSTTGRGMKGGRTGSHPKLE